MSAPLAAFFDPETVAVIGASRDPSKVGGSVLANLRSAGFAGRVVPVNTRAEAVQGVPAVRSVLEVDGAVDLAVITVPAPGVLPALKECAAKGVRGAVVISAGFRETGDEGRAREAELRAWLRDQPLRVVGPNCLGWIRPSRRLNLTFAPGLPPVGSIAFVSHSGALAVAILDWARDRRMGFSLFASLGNQADVTETDLLRAVAADAESRVIVGYFEGVADGRAFVQALRAAAAVKPVVLLKAGRSAEGARAVSSHTGALAGSDAAFDAAVRQAGAVRVRTIEELFDLARALESQPLPRGRRLAVLTNGGGLGIVATDAARDAGLEVPPTPEPARNRLQRVLPPTAGLGNPIDLVGDADAARFSNALHALGDAEADLALILLTAQATTDSLGVARAISGATRGWSIPVAVAFVGGPRVSAGAHAIEDAGLPCFPFPERAVAALAGMAVLAERRRAPATEPSPGVPPPAAVAGLERLLAAGVSRPGLPDLEPLLRAYGIGTVPSEVTTTADEVGAAADRLGYPVALKIVSPDVTHKSDVGGVRLGLASCAEVVEAARAMHGRVAAREPRVTVAGFMVQRMVPPGRELLLGVVRDPQFGPLVVVGFGGVYVEVVRDTALRLAPVSASAALAMLDELRLAPLLRGIRGEPPVDRAAVAETVSRFSRLAAELPALVEIEVNPLVAWSVGATAVDARATLTPPRPAAPAQGA